MKAPLLVSDYLSEEKISFFNEGATKDQIIAAFVKSLPYPKPQAALSAILEREKSGGTVIGPGIAIPHARLADVSDIMAGLAICPAGIKEPSTEGPVKFFLLFIGPAKNMKINLAFLASIASLFLTEGFTDSLIQFTSAQAVLAKIRETEKH